MSGGQIVALCALWCLAGAACCAAVAAPLISRWKDAARDWEAAAGKWREASEGWREVGER